MTGKYYCHCARFCKGGKYVCKATFYKHAPLRFDAPNARPIVLDVPDGEQGQDHGDDLGNAPNDAENATGDQEEPESNPTTPNEFDLMQTDNIFSAGNVSMDAGDSLDDVGDASSPSLTDISEILPFYEKLILATNNLASTGTSVFDLLSQIIQASSGDSGLLSAGTVGSLHQETGNEFDVDIGRAEEETEPERQAPSRPLSPFMDCGGESPPEDRPDHYLSPFSSGDFVNTLGARPIPKQDGYKYIPFRTKIDRPREGLTFINTTVNDFHMGPYDCEEELLWHRIQGNSVSAEDNNGENNTTSLDPDEVESDESDESTSPPPSPFISPQLDPKKLTPRMIWISRASHQALVDSANPSYMTLRDEYHRLHEEHQLLRAHWSKFQGEHGRLHKHSVNLQLAVHFYRAEGMHIKADNAAMHDEIMRLRSEVARLGGNP
ncbi:hypothetical protein ONZ45_g7217 [Pleurotus djamor]|nr:hypothetical protein ONZ45_g7217 [Pleurotus djamor]